ncbi:MAG: hypothetical protein U0401_29815 [Anaerolineae bacterium]
MTKLLLLKALNEGLLCLVLRSDVFAEEPAINNPVAQHKQVIATPHIAASTADAQRTAAITVARKIIEALRDVERENPCLSKLYR